MSMLSDREIEFAPSIYFSIQELKKGILITTFPVHDEPYWIKIEERVPRLNRLDQKSRISLIYNFVIERHRKEKKNTIVDSSFSTAFLYDE